MIDKYLAKIFGTKHEREVKAMRPIVAAINDLEPRMQELSDVDLAAQTIDFSEQLAQGATLDDLLIQAFAAVREAGRRVLNMRHFDVQLIGGMVLHRGKIAEMKTGEGKTLVATLPVYLNALAGKGVHVVTVNDYLAKRDSEWMGRIYKVLGLTRRRDRARSGRPGAPGQLRLRHHLRHQQRIRLRLPARQHEVPHRGLRAARALLRHRRRSGFHPDRRSAHAADHFRAQRGIHRQVLQDQPHHSPV